ncbi:MAG: 2,3-bisphosphoglycerate-independent phosphoglycerate mutase [Eubacteriales bacterium]|nr:2,3-bisphosphoglycerate-independent phosphoglycerate mutase [Eubacteriales bacterium]
MEKTMTALIIMDGFGINPAHEGNAIYQAGTPNLDKLMAKYPHTQLGASSMDVGLPDGQMGNSEVGHLNIGAGRIVYQELTRITKDIQDGEFFKKAPLIHAMDAAQSAGKAVHLMGLLSDGGVHSHNSHLYALLEMCKQRGVKNVYVHCFLDGRDVPPTSGLEYVRELEAKLKEIGVGEIATVMGRYWAMDRDNLWDRVQKAYDAMVLGVGKTAESAEEAVQQSYDSDEKDKTDEFVKPTVVLKAGKPVATIQPEDSVIFFNFRPDRARQLTRTFIQPDFAGFERGNGYFHVNFVSMTQYDETFTGLEVVNPPASLTNTLGEYVSSLGKTQLRIAETQKYAHVTFFFNGGVELANPGEDRELIPSSKVATFDLKPEMSAYEVTDKAVELINAKKYDMMILNFANCDMVGHTGVMEAAEKAVRVVDECVMKVLDAILANGGHAFVTADHGNADQMIDPKTGEPFTAHTTNPVPFIAVGPEMVGRKLRDGGRLADIAPTMLDSMGIAVPAEMTGKSLLA